MVDSLGDRWSYYLDPEEAQRTREARSNAYVGIGVTVSQEPSDGLEIVGVTGSPAREAGLQVGRSSAPWTARPSSRRPGRRRWRPSRGEGGHLAHLEVEAARRHRPDGGLQRKQVHGITAAWKLLEDQVGLVTIQNFYAGTADPVKQGVAGSRPVWLRALVFDVRNNPGDMSPSSRRSWMTCCPRGKFSSTGVPTGRRRFYTSDADQCGPATHGRCW
ncbi:MAG: S41 family peptidase [Evtepia gabavorous]